MWARRPFGNRQALCAAAREVWGALTEKDWLEAFSHHPKIGDTEALQKKFAGTRQWAAGEQAGSARAAPETLEALARGNQDYERRFGFIFIICATGKSADEMLALLETRLKNSPYDELSIAAQEQAKITRVRLKKLLSSLPSPRLRGEGRVRGS
jgi:2-oxo-4-hydroxy-4-carboxy-5-ureidoimidazoline decarboxylase